MKKLPEVTLRYHDLFELLNGSIRSKLLLTGVELKVFDVLSEPTSATDVAQALGTHPRNTEAFLDGLAAIDLLRKRQGRYRNAPLAQAFLVERSPTYLGRLFAAMKPDEQFLQNLPALVTKGPPPPPETPPFSKEALARGVVMMADVERAGYAQRMMQIAVGLPEFPSFRRMLDLGGGPGLIGMAIVDAHPSMTGVNFDLPPVAQIAQAYIEEYGMSDRVEVRGGNFNRDPIGEGYDLVWASGVLQFATDIDVVVRKVYAALTPGGVFVSVYPFSLTSERTKPEPNVLSLLSTVMRGQELGTEQGRIAASMLRAGFRTVRSRILPTPFTHMELDIARK